MKLVKTTYGDLDRRVHRERRRGHRGPSSAEEVRRLVVSTDDSNTDENGLVVSTVFGTDDAWFASRGA